MINAAQVSSYHCRVTRFVLRPGQRQAPERSIRLHHLRRLSFDIGGELHVPELADVKVATAGTPRPAQEDAACGLHQALADHDTLAVMWYRRMPSIAFEHRGARILDPEK
jgi:hypothetical protein